MTSHLIVRRLEEGDFDRLHEIDVSEQIPLIFRVVDGVLRPEPHDWLRPRWDQEYWEARVQEWRDHLQPDVWLGAFLEGRLAGEASLRYVLEPGMAQLTTLHVDRESRRRGVGRRLLREVQDIARASGAVNLYVSATESESAVGFYLSEGFRLTAKPNPRMLELEPKDIHLVRQLDPSQV